MELGLSLGDRSTASVDRSTKKRKEMGFCMGLGGSDGQEKRREEEDEDRCRSRRSSRVSSSDRDGEDGDDEDDGVHVPLQLELLPSVPVRRSHVTASKFGFPWLTQNYGPGKGFQATGPPATAVALTAEEATEEGATISSPNSTLSSFHMDFCVRTRDVNNNNMTMMNKLIRSESELEGERASSRASDDDENGSTRKKLRLSKEQSAFLEESFKEHSTLNPKQKLALAKQLNLRPRQVEVWFQNRRARTKLKQTEVDCEYLKRCCETLTDENRRLQKELQELRALKTSQPFYMQLPATTLTMCPSCERVATTSSKS